MKFGFQQSTENTCFASLCPEMWSYWHNAGKIHTFSRLLTQDKAHRRDSGGVRARFCDSPKTRRWTTLSYVEREEGGGRLVFRRPIDPAAAIFTAAPLHQANFTSLKSASKAEPGLIIDFRASQILAFSFLKSYRIDLQRMR